MKKLITPSNKVIEEYLHKFDNDKDYQRYYLADNAIIKLFDKFPDNKNLEDILLKISVINDLYSTNIYATYLLAEHIQSLNIDKELKKGNSNLVNKIASGHGIKSTKSKKDRNFYSFATKYCNWHNRNEYPIYDSFVDKILKEYRNKEDFYKFKGADLHFFEKFKEVIQNFKEFYGLNKYDLKQIDKFLWMYGKEFVLEKKKGDNK